MEGVDLAAASFLAKSVKSHSAVSNEWQVTTVQNLTARRMAHKTLSHSREEHEFIPSSTVIAASSAPILAPSGTPVRRSNQGERADCWAFQAIKQNVISSATFATHLVCFTN